MSVSVCLLFLVFLPGGRGIEEDEWKGLLIGGRACVCTLLWDRVKGLGCRVVRGETIIIPYIH